MANLPEQIDIMINSECNAHCQMCVQEITWKLPTGQTGRFLEGVNSHLREYYEAGGRKVIITGGEPTLRPERVIPILEELDSNYSDMKLIAMYTNGSRLLMETKGKTIAQSLQEKGLQCLNLSVHHYDREKNSRILGIGASNISAITKHLKKIGLPFRFCATLQKGGLENAEDVSKYLSFAKRSGAKDVYLRELFKIVGIETGDKAYKNLEYISHNFLPINKIIDELVAKGAITVGRRNNFPGRQKDELEFITADGFPFYTSQLEIGNEKENEIPYLVVMPDGNLYTTWLGESYRINSIREIK